MIICPHTRLFHILPCCTFTLKEVGAVAELQHWSDMPSHHTWGLQYAYRFLLELGIYTLLSSSCFPFTRASTCGRPGVTTKTAPVPISRLLLQWITLKYCVLLPDARPSCQLRTE